MHMATGTYPNGGLLRDLREVRMVTAHQLQALAGVAITTISSIENGRNQAQMTTLQKLAKGLGVPTFCLRPLRSMAAVDYDAAEIIAEADRLKAGAQSKA